MKAFVSAVFQAINRVLEPIGLRLMRTNAPVRNFALFFKHLKSLGFEVKTVIDVGIAFGHLTDLRRVSAREIFSGRAGR